MSCPIIKNLRIVPGNLDDYRALSCYHYRDTVQSKSAPIASIFKLQASIPALRTASTPALRTASTPALRTASTPAEQGSNMNEKTAARTPRSVPTALPQSSVPAAVIVYTFPLPEVALRNLALADLLTGLDRQTKLALINKNIRTISRVVVEPRFRGLGLAVKLVKQTMPRLNVPIIEAMAVMGTINPFFEKAGLKPYYAPLPLRCAKLIQAFAWVGIEQDDLIDARKVAKKIEKLPAWQAQFIHQQMDLFLSGCRSKKHHPGLPPHRDPEELDRIRYILTKLTERPVYYIWLNKKLNLRWK